VHGRMLSHGPHVWPNLAKSRVSALVVVTL
jgi:hypothetical protein